MGRKRKNRTHLKGVIPTPEAGVPKSFIIKHGQVGASLTQLVRDVRKVMEPNTASRLKERNRNKLKDYLTMAPALQVTHLLAFTLTDIAPSLRIVRLSAGPTLSFRVERYSLMKDILNTSRHARSIGMEYLSSPLLVLASFPPASPTTPPHIPLLMKTFQTMFPPLSPQTITLSSARRVVLVSYNADRETVDFRHYVITVKPYGVSKRVRRVLEGATTKSSSASGILDLGNEKDVADFMLRRRGEAGPDGGYESAASSTESVAGDDGDAVDLADDYVGRNNKKGQRRAVRLDEIGPRMELRLVKIAEGVPGKEGNVIYHHFVKKTKKEIASQKAEHAAKAKLKQERRDEQERNVQRKKASAKSGDKKGADEDEDEDEGEAMDGISDEEDPELDEHEGNIDEHDNWDGDEEISEGEDSEDEADEAAESSADEEEVKRPDKKSRIRGKR
ncbi:hypothetical protein DXG01_015115 [Tephrocybe rancida]|nr:hypothetical protein DXG01_015115 [Tephrocybe rancida]